MSRLSDFGRQFAAPRHQALWVLLISGVLGFYLGMRVYPDWQVAVEAAQVVAGLVKYPAGNPFYVYETKLWTILHQICALGLLAGVSEITLCRIVSGAMGMLGLQALSMCVFAICRRAPLAIGASLFILATRSASNGATYPIRLMSTEHTYGSVGLSTFVLAAASLAGGLPGLGGFLVGLMPAVHPSLGLWLWILVGIGIAWDWRFAQEEFRPAFKWFVAGAAVTTISLVVQLTVTSDAPSVDPAEAAKYFYAFISFWDVHRTPIDLNSLAVLANRAALAFGLIWLVGFKAQLPTRSASFLLRVIVVGAAIGLTMAYVSWIPPERIPQTILTLMPSRLLNFNGMIVIAALIGLLGCYQSGPAGAALLTLLLGGLLLSNRSMLWEWGPAFPWAWLQQGFDPMIVIELVGTGLLCLAGVQWFTRPEGLEGLEPSRSSAGRTTARVFGFVSLAAMAFTGFLTLRLRPEVHFRDRTNDPFFAAVAAEQDGIVLLAGSYQLVQAFTRRPVLLDGALDTLPYAPETGPEMQRILLEVYGADLLNPPAIAREAGVLPREFHRTLWEHYSPQKWHEIRRDFDVHVVLVPGDWRLDLPIAQDNGAFRLYRIPG